MQKSQYLVVVVVIIAFVVALVWANRAAKAPRLGSTSTTFFARSGTMRDRAQMLVSGKKDLPATTGTAAQEPGEGDRAHSIKSISPREQEETDALYREAARAALLAVTPEEGIQQLRALLAEGAPEAGAAEAYSALGSLYTRLKPPDLEKARDAFATAARFAIAPARRHEVLYAQAVAWLSLNLPVDALDQIETSLTADEILSPGLLRIRVLQGNMLEETGDMAAAERAFRQVVDQPVETFKALGADSVDVYRQACLRLTRLCQKQSRDKEAQAVGREMNRKLRLMEGQ
ncbi:MAG TPA: hypothetical protein PLO37_07560 [Candidatus Hydrogenedentes bacterium]|nr:hypothetical protein [Candidatus Hydrogenedentota bacterium]HPG66688.1 hypothetical protein [Candidatus Hydrogenedentota bacterium]